MKEAADYSASAAYIGEELELFQYAQNWKRYFASRLQTFLSGEVLEVGAGMGVNVPYLHNPRITRWISIEPDERLARQYQDRQLEGKIPAACELRQMALRSLHPDETFDSIIYIDVLEHIEDDRLEFATAYEHLRPGGHLAILCPAHAYLFSPFDKAIGHFRRYDKKMYRALSARQPVLMEYLDSAGMLASLANKLLLKRPFPSKEQVLFWDARLVPVSRVVDPLLAHSLGKSILGIWRK
jgi:SAM-dependent methyltransferase